ncbi:MAG: DoxX-like family protein [Flavobacteriales bacterium]|jgi:hypothetical protein
MSYRLLTICLAAVWLVNGLWCKVLGQTPRHEMIVARILGDEYAREMTMIIGIGEIAIALWIVSGYFIRLHAMLQISLVIVMNCIEFALAPDLLLWGRFNLIFASFFAGSVYYTFMVLQPKMSSLKKG